MLTRKTEKMKLLRVILKTKREREMRGRRRRKGIEKEFGECVEMKEKRGKRKSDYKKGREFVEERKSKAV